jgi:acrylyl-CoA reductase (NADPH)
MSPFRAYRIHQVGGQIAAQFDSITLDDLAAGDVVIKVACSSINYKDALAATGAGKILRRYPLVGGIDLAGEVVSSTNAALSIGQKVVVNGCSLSETHDGGYAEYARVQSDWVVPLPEGINEFQAMALGTAGFTAALAIHRMEQNGQAPDQGEVLVNGATGGVGSVAIDLLAGRGYRVVALSGKKAAEGYLKELGASRILSRESLSMGTKPLEVGQWAGAIDNVGGEVLSWLTRTTKPMGNIASVGNAASHELNTTVMPFILRGVNLLGINSVLIPRQLRLDVWRRLATDLRPRHLDRIVTRTIDFNDLPGAFGAYIEGSVTGRTVVRIASR